MREGEFSGWQSDAGVQGRAVRASTTTVAGGQRSDVNEIELRGGNQGRGKARGTPRSFRGAEGRGARRCVGLLNWTLEMWRVQLPTCRKGPLGAASVFPGPGTGSWQRKWLSGRTGILDRET